jgi:hypothetical protein
MVFANDRHVERERVNVNKYGEEFRRADAFFQPLVMERARGACPRSQQTSSRSMQRWRAIGGLRPHVSAYELAAEAEHQDSGAQREPWSQCARRMVTRTTQGQPRGTQAPPRFSCRAAAVADGKPPTASILERAGGDRDF